MIYLMVTSLIWSFSFGLIKSELAGLNPYFVSGVRLALSLLVFLPFLRRVPPRNALTLMGIGAIQFGLMYCLYIYSYRFLQGHQVALLTITTPLFVVLIDAALRGKWIGRYWLASILSVMAAWVLIEGNPVAGTALAGVLLIQGANLCFAAGQLLYKRFQRGKGRQSFGWLYLGAVVVPCLFLGLVDSSGIRPPTGSQWLSLLYLGLIPSGLGFFLWNKGVTLVNSGTAAAMNNLKIPLGALVAWTLFGETLHWLSFLVSGLLFLLALRITRNA